MLDLMLENKQRKKKLRKTLSKCILFLKYLKSN